MKPHFLKTKKKIVTQTPAYLYIKKKHFCHRCNHYFVKFYFVPLYQNICFFSDNTSNLEYHK